MDENPLTGVCLLCGDRVNNLEQHYMAKHHSTPTAPTGATGVCLFCGDRVDNLEQHYLDTHQTRSTSLSGESMEGSRFYLKIVWTLWGYRGMVVSLILGWAVMVGLFLLAAWLISLSGS